MTDNNTSSTEQTVAELLEEKVLQVAGLEVQIREWKRVTKVNAEKLVRYQNERQAEVDKKVRNAEHKARAEASRNIHKREIDPLKEEIASLKVLVKEKTFDIGELTLLNDSHGDLNIRRRLSKELLMDVPAGYMETMLKSLCQLIEECEEV